jgi:methylenetetrahydrofolate dehydrogenase (NADP+)/methenyltetrahydrofolate cyclohydrolase
VVQRSVFQQSGWYRGLREAGVRWFEPGRLREFDTRELDTRELDTCELHLRGCRSLQSRGLDELRRALGCMSHAKILDGNALAVRVLGELEVRVARAKSRGVTPCLAVVLVGEDPASKIYVRSKERKAAQVGIETRDHRFAATTSTEHLLGLIAELNADSSVHGILVQLPLPVGVDEQRVLRAVDPSKDVDGFHPDNLGLLMLGTPRFVACTPQGCMRLIALAEVDPAGKRALVVGRSNIVGKPVAQLLLHANATVTIAHSRTRDLEAEVRRAEIVVAAVGRPEFIRGEWIQPGACVIDVGINRTNEKLVGDVEFAAASERAGSITPVPGGVGPMTIACLLANVVDAAERAH